MQRLARRGHRVRASATPSASIPRDVWRTVEREGIDFLLIVGDAFARPLLDELERGDYDRPASTCCCQAARRCPLGCKQELLERLPTLMVVDGMGSSEAGGQLAHVSDGERRGDRHVHAAAGHPRAVGRPLPRAGAR